MNGHSEHTAYERSALAMLGELIVGLAGAAVLIVAGFVTADWWTGLSVMADAVAAVTERLK